MFEFPHTPPTGYTYEIVSHRRNILSIWICNHGKFSYTDDTPVKSIWGFYDTKKKCYHAPINSTKHGNTIDFRDTTPYSAMPLLKLALDSAQEDQPAPIIDSSTQGTMTATTLKQEFSDFCPQRDPENTIELNIVKYGLMLCDALVQDAPDGYGFYLDSTGRKYHKVFMTIDGKRTSIHCFIDKKTGEVYKPASIKQPAKGVRFNMLIISDREDILERCDWAGGYPYLR